MHPTASLKQLSSQPSLVVSSIQAPHLAFPWSKPSKAGAGSACKSMRVLPTPAPVYWPFCTQARDAGEACPAGCQGRGKPCGWWEGGCAAARAGAKHVRMALGAPNEARMHQATRGTRDALLVRRWCVCVWVGEWVDAGVGMGKDVSTVGLRGSQRQNTR